MAEPEADVRSPSWLWHVGVTAPALSALDEPWLMMSACLSPRPRGLRGFCTHICASQLARHWATTAISSTYFAVMAFKFCFDLIEFLFVEQLQPIQAIITIAVCIIEPWEIKNKYSILWNRQEAQIPSFRILRKMFDKSLGQRKVPKLWLNRKSLRIVRQRGVPLELLGKQHFKKANLTLSNQPSLVVGRCLVTISYETCI